MHDKRTDKPDILAPNTQPQPLKSMSQEEFAALGASTMVFVRPITGAELAKFIPEAVGAPENAAFQMVMAADGSPILVTDNDEAISDWLEDKQVKLMPVH